MFESLTAFIHQANHNIIAMQVYSCENGFCHIWFPFGFIVCFETTTTFYRKETFLCHPALNVYQSVRTPGNIVDRPSIIRHGIVNSDGFLMDLLTSYVVAASGTAPLGDASSSRLAG